MLRSLATLALLIPLAFAPAAAATPGPTPSKAATTQADGKRKKRTAKHKKHRKHKRTSRKKTGGARN